MLLACHRKVDPEARLAEGLDLALGSRLLRTEIVAGHTKNYQATVAIPPPERLKAVVLRGQAAGAGGIDDKHRLAAEARQGQRRAIDGRERKGMGVGHVCLSGW